MSLPFDEKLKRMHQKGFRYAATAALLGVTTSAVSAWSLGKKKCASAQHKIKVEWLYDALEDLMSRFKAQFGEAS